jgi:hypothetical protein
MTFRVITRRKLDGASVVLRDKLPRHVAERFATLLKRHGPPGWTVAVEGDPAEKSRNENPPSPPDSQS